LNNTTFGDYLKSQRNQRKIASSKLSKEIGKAGAYVSQIERGLIKNPSYEVCYELLRLLNVDEAKIQSVLNYYGIYSDKQINAQVIEQDNIDWIDIETSALKLKNSNIHALFDKLIDKDISRADIIVRNLEKLIESKSLFDFLNHFLKYDYSQIDEVDRKELINMMDRFISNRYDTDAWGELEKRGEKK
jgi:transcriptional regulator with XRE-family HTH domain